MNNAIRLFIRLTINWLLFLSLPIVGGTLMFAFAIIDLRANKNSSLRQALKGREWLA